MKYTKKPVTIEAITFDEFVAHGAKVDPAGAAMHGGYSWHFEYQGHPITHENDNCYLIPTLEGTMRFERGDMLITGVKGEIYPCKADIFALTYDPAKGGNPYAGHDSHDFAPCSSLGGEVCRSCGAPRGTSRALRQCGEAVASFGEVAI